MSATDSRLTSRYQAPTPRSMQHRAFSFCLFSKQLSKFHLPMESRMIILKPFPILRSQFVTSNFPNNSCFSIHLKNKLWLEIYFFALKPILPTDSVFSLIICLIASNTTRNFLSYLLSIFSILSRKSLCVKSISLSSVNTRIMWILI